ncbi:MAG: hypothetical protein F6K54_15910 [Okeania sp. SIO3B5]|uniref:LodA/GoxA family CTQ-dependent oxidase n=1 Tax=Okeania sp. SIO3B5 TaxID=2607811 RepID=UPI0013FF6DA9|nr:LodA/GoxA family CTQ-dependent oxidase [Okeania sp. SIO3B5]NEO54437.1 hypothetical protein [Okeania sp. SIO3B5]
MSESDFVYRVHPAIGMARVGNSEEYYIAPESMAGRPDPNNPEIMGGLPIEPGTESKTITSSDLRDKNGALKRQAARFRIYQYPEQEQECYPNGEGIEINIGSNINGKTVTDIIWTVHLANKKANNYVLENPNLGAYQSIIDGYKDGSLPPPRNLLEGPKLNSRDRLQKLVIDPGPRTIKGTDETGVKFDKCTQASCWESGTNTTPLPNYPKSFPEDNFEKLYSPVGNIDTLGELETDSQGHLLVLGAYGRASAWYQDDDTPYPLNDDVDNDGWFDDTADGPVCAVLVFDDGTTQEVHGAWIVSTDPAYAPQILNVVSLWEDIYDSWVRELRLCPAIFQPDRGYNYNYIPYFDRDLSPFFQAAGLQRWVANLPRGAIQAHKTVEEIQSTDRPAETILTGLAYIRNPNNPTEASVGAPLMPFHLGDQGQPFLSPTFTQYFFLTQWNDEKFNPGLGPKLGAGEYLDKATLVNCLGGRFSPGIDMTFIVRQPDIYIQDWETSGSGPFRIKHKPLDYNTAQLNEPFLTEGYVPLHKGSCDGLEPGDTSKFLAIPWHTDYNSCATHETAPNPSTPRKSSTLYWSWPAQRPVAVYVAQDVTNGELGSQFYAVRGTGTESSNPQNQGRYQNRLDILANWHRIGVVMQGNAIDTGTYSREQYLEVESQLSGELDESGVQPWPINAKSD